MMQESAMKIVLVVVVFMGVRDVVEGRPGVNSRVKRVSDTHLQDLETRLALTKLKGFTITLPVAGGKDLDRIGRKRRSQSRALDFLFNQSGEDNNSEHQMDDILNDFQPIENLHAIKSKRFSRFSPMSDKVSGYPPISDRLGQDQPINAFLFKDYDEDPFNYRLRINK